MSSATFQVELVGVRENENGRERLESRAEDLGRYVEGVLRELGAGWRLERVVRNIDTPTWRLEIETPDGRRNVVLPWDMVNMALDARTPSEFDRVKNMVLLGLGRSDLLRSRR